MVIYCMTSFNTALQVSCIFLFRRRISCTSASDAKEMEVWRVLYQ